MLEYPDAARTAEAREELLAQIAHLIDETEALRQHLGIIPDDVLTGRPLASDPSFKEIYGMIAAIDEQVYAPALDALENGSEGSVSMPDAAEFLTGSTWNERHIETLIDGTQSARAALVERLEKLDVDAWKRTVSIDDQRSDVFGLAYSIAQHDASLLQAAAYRLHESRLSNRDRRTSDHS